MVTVWSKPSCVQCNATKNWLSKNNIDYIEKDLLADPNTLEAFRELGISSAPVVEFEGVKTFGGFQPDRLQEIKDAL
jgi:glutaredoxin-like protein NrdH